MVVIRRSRPGSPMCAAFFLQHPFHPDKGSGDRDEKEFLWTGKR